MTRPDSWILGTKHSIILDIIHLFIMESSKKYICRDCGEQFAKWKWANCRRHIVDCDHMGGGRETKGLQQRCLNTLQTVEEAQEAPPEVPDSLSDTSPVEAPQPPSGPQLKYICTECNQQFSGWGKCLNHAVQANHMHGSLVRAKCVNPAYDKDAPSAAHSVGNSSAPAVNIEEWQSADAKRWMSRIKSHILTNRKPWPMLSFYIPMKKKTQEFPGRLTRKEHVMYVVSAIKDNAMFDFYTTESKQEYVYASHARYGITRPIEEYPPLSSDNLSLLPSNFSVNLNNDEGEDKGDSASDRSSNSDDALEEERSCINNIA